MLFRVRTKTETKTFRDYEAGVEYARLNDVDQVEIQGGTVTGGWREVASCEVNDDED